jgi:serine/threonine-protein kinase
VLYEMLVGEPPYTGSTPQAVLGKIVTGEPDPATKHRRTVPANVDGAIRKALEKVPADRFGSASDFARALGEAGFRHGEVAGVGGAFGGSAAGPWNRLTVAFASLAAVFALTFAWSLARPEPPEPVERFAVDTYQFGQTGRPSLLPDGSGMVYGAGQLMLRRWGSLDPVPVAGGEQLHGAWGWADGPSCRGRSRAGCSPDA